MNRDKFKILLYEISNKRIELMFKKGDDYATEDILSNFKRMSELCVTLGVCPQRSPTDCALFLLLLKLDRWCNLLRKGIEPKNESIQDTILDLHNYTDLAYACQIDTELDSGG